MDPLRRKRRVKSRIRHHRSLKILLLCLGLAGLVMSGLFAAFFILAESPDRPRWLRLFVGYLLGSFILLAWRQTLIMLGQIQRQHAHRHSQPHLAAALRDEAAAPEMRAAAGNPGTGEAKPL